jgi:hypothetical protein
MQYESERSATSATALPSMSFWRKRLRTSGLGVEL